jgi:hypothetical protein
MDDAMATAVEIQKTALHPSEVEKDSASNPVRAPRVNPAIKAACVPKLEKVAT